MEIISVLALRAANLTALLKPAYRVHATKNCNYPLSSSWVARFPWLPKSALSFPPGAVSSEGSIHLSFGISRKFCRIYMMRLAFRKRTSKNLRNLGNVYSQRVSIVFNAYWCNWAARKNANTRLHCPFRHQIYIDVLPLKPLIWNLLSCLAISSASLHPKLGESATPPPPSEPPLKLSLHLSSLLNWKPRFILTERMCKQIIPLLFRGYRYRAKLNVPIFYCFCTQIWLYAY